MATTDIQYFCSNEAASGGNRLSVAAYEALTTLLANGFQAGVAQSVQVNTVLSQCSFMAAGLANWMVAQGVSVPDNGNLGNLVTEITTALTTFVSTISNSTPPSTVRLTSGTAAMFATPTNASGANAKKLRIRMQGAGSGGQGGLGNYGTAGGATSFNGITANGGTAASSNNGGAGGSGGALLRQAGNSGSQALYYGGMGGVGVFGGQVTNLASGTTAPDANSACGGNGGFTSNTGSPGGIGGGAGEYVMFEINAPTGNYSYTVGAHGTGGAHGGSNGDGSNGADGWILVEAFF